MAIPDLNTFPPAIVDLDPTPQVSLPVMAWMLEETADLIPESAAPWLLSQGWRLGGMTYDTKTVPPTPYYNFNRDSMATSAVLQSLVNVYTDQFNEGRKLNADRYNNIVTNWSSLIDATIADLNAAADASNATLGLMINKLDAAVAEVGGYISDERVEALTKFNELSAQIYALVTKLDELEEGFSDYSTALDATLAKAGVDLAAYQAASQAGLASLLTDYNAILALVRGIETQYSSDVTAHIVQFTVQLDELPTDYFTHAAKAEGFLEGLGATELARINEQFAASLAAQIQEVTDRGMYSSIVATDLRARNIRDRDEQIAALNDRLNREKLGNEHQLYDQLRAMRGGVMEGLDRILKLRGDLAQWRVAVESGLENELTAARLKIVEGIERRFGVGWDIDKARMEQRAQRFGLQRETLITRGAVTDAQARHIGSRAQVMNSLAAFNMELTMKSVQTALGKNTQEMDLIKYQVDATNNLIVGLFAFQEKRFDNYPSMDVLAQLCMALGDSAATSWVSP